MLTLRFPTLTLTRSRWDFFYIYRSDLVTLAPCLRYKPKAGQTTIIGLSHFALSTVRTATPSKACWTSMVTTMYETCYKLHILDVLRLAAPACVIWSSHRLKYVFKKIFKLYVTFMKMSTLTKQEKTKWKCISYVN